ncbi:uncharacterized protein LOC134243808 [Saccostrea cucullata]|uniref:uncharacterized protein LOC134243808 n=1 Tax=Saccostrea cuccullata TaxID=36930 RepID=UPI002ED60012
MSDFKVYWILSIFSVVSSDTIPSSVPNLYPSYGMQVDSYSNRYTRHIYEGDLMKFECYLSSLGDPPITWTWYCGEEVMKNVTFSSNYLHTYMNFTATRKHDKKPCYCRAKSPSTILFYDETSRYRYKMRVYHSPWTRPRIYTLSPRSVQNGEYIHIKCILTTLGYPQISWKWFCGEEPPQNGVEVGTETYLAFKASPSHDGMVCRCRGISSSSSYYTYDEVSDPVTITVLSTTKEESDCISSAAFGTTTGILVVVILALVSILILQYIRVKKEGFCSCENFGKAIEGKTSENSGEQNPTYINDQSYEVLEINRERL